MTTSWQPRLRALVIVASLLAATVAWADLVAPSVRPDARARCRRALEPLRERLGKVSSPPRRLVAVDSDDGVDLRWLPEAERGGPVAACTIGLLRVPQGTLTLPPGWIAVDQLALDSSDARTGALLDARGAERLRYDIGPRAGARADVADGALLDWHRLEVVGGVALHSRLAQGRLTMTLLPDTNFSGPAPTRAESDALLAIVRTLRP